MKTFRHNSSHDGLVHLLFETPNKRANQAIFVTKRDLLCFAAVLGFEIGRRGKITQKPTDFVEPFAIKEHQRIALEKWRAQDLQGILALATGAGKTITALYAATRLFIANKGLFLVVAVPYIHSF